MAGPEATPVRDAATVVLVRQGGAEPALLMGQRGAAAAFMPDKYVFPGGALDDADWQVPLAVPPDPLCAARLEADGRPGLAAALAAGAVRELWEETGLILGRPGRWPVAPPAGWQSFAATGHLPDAGALRFVFRAITPPGRTRRFDARFFLADAAAIAGDPEDFGRASDELGHLHWVPMSQARRLNLPFITEVVLGEVAALLEAAGDGDAGIPFFDNSGPVPAFRRIR
ncbi:NUDIX hydrolase [Albidovulum sp.]